MGRSSGRIAHGGGPAASAKERSACAAATHAQVVPGGASAMTRQSYLRPVVRPIVALAALLGALLAPGSAHAAPPAPEPSRFFPQTQQTVSGPFLAAWQAGRAEADSLRLDGLPLSDTHEEVSLTDGKIYQV